MTDWKMVAEDVRFVRELPEHTEFTANVYECSNCKNRMNDKGTLPSKCPWCGADVSATTERDARLAWNRMIQEA